MIRSIYATALGDAMIAYEIMEEFHGDCDIRMDAYGECHITAPAKMNAIKGGKTMFDMCLIILLEEIYNMDSKDEMKDAIKNLIIEMDESEISMFAFED